ESQDPARPEHLESDQFPADRGVLEGAGYKAAQRVTDACSRSCSRQILEQFIAFISPLPSLAPHQDAQCNVTEIIGFCRSNGEWKGACTYVSLFHAGHMCRYMIGADASSIQQIL